MAARIVPSGLVPGEIAPVTSLPGGIVPPKPAVNPDNLTLISPTRFRTEAGMQVGIRGRLNPFIKPPVIVVTKPDPGKVNVSNPYMNTGRLYLPATPSTRPVGNNFNTVVPNMSIMPAKPVISSNVKTNVAETVISPRNVEAPIVKGSNAVILSKQKEAAVALLPATQGTVAPAPVEAGVPMIVWIIAGGIALGMLFGRKR